MSTPALYRRILRRETHSSRAGLAIVLAVVLMLALAWVATESVLALVNQPALLVAPGIAFKAAAELPITVVTPALLAIGVATAVVGVVIVLFALLPGRRARHTGSVGRTAVVVDDQVIASSLARSASYTANIHPDQVVVTVGRRTVRVRVRPTSGFDVDTDEISKAVQHELDDFGLTPSLRSSITVEQKGVVGS